MECRVNLSKVGSHFVINKKMIHPCSPSIKNVLFFTELYNTGAGYSVITTTRSALSGIISIPGIPSISVHPLVYMPRYT